MQTGPTGWAAWQASIKEVHPNVGLSPASVMLSAYGFYDGTERDKDGHTRPGGSHALQQYLERFPAGYTPLVALGLPTCGSASRDCSQKISQLVWEA